MWQLPCQNLLKVMEWHHSSSRIDGVPCSHRQKHRILSIWLLHSLEYCLDSPTRSQHVSILKLILMSNKSFSDLKLPPWRYLRISHEQLTYLFANTSADTFAILMLRVFLKYIFKCLWKQWDKNRNFIIQDKFT